MLFFALELFHALKLLLAKGPLPNLLPPGSPKTTLRLLALRLFLFMKSSKSNLISGYFARLLHHGEHAYNHYCTPHSVPSPRMRNNGSAGRSKQRSLGRIIFQDWSDASR